MLDCRLHHSPQFHECVFQKKTATVLSYINADPVLAKRLQDVGTATVSNPGLETRGQNEIIIRQAAVPVVVDAGIGAPSDGAEALEMGADAVLQSPLRVIPFVWRLQVRHAVTCVKQCFDHRT